MYMMEGRDVGGDRDYALEMHVWLISWVGSEHIPRWHCEAQTQGVAHPLGDTAEPVAGRLDQLPACDAHRIGDGKANCASTSSLYILCWHKSWGTSAWEPSYHLHTGVGNASENWVWVVSIDETNLWHLLGFPLLFVWPAYCCTAVRHLLRKSSKTVLELC